MAEYASQDSLGGRVKAARKSRGIRSIRELAGLLAGTGLTESVLENIEAGRKTDLPISELLNLAFAMKVPPAFLLAPLAASKDSIDLANLSPELSAMSAAEFDAWLSGESAGAYRSTSATERNDLAELAAFRELQRTKRELEREQVIADLAGAAGSRREFLERQSSELTKFLQSAGWTI